MKEAQMSIDKRIEEIHGGDSKQLAVITSEKKRMIVEAPAGYGKTATMVSRIAYLYSKGKIPNPKKVLALTFSVNAALKIKRDVAEKLPKLINEENNPINVGERVSVTNYHGFCKSVLKKYGYILTDILKRDINLFYALGEGDIIKDSDLSLIPNDELQYLSYIEDCIKSATTPKIHEIEEYNRIVIKYLLPKDKITHNAIILFVLELLYKKPNIKVFYQNFFPVLIVDEFQDTNCISWCLLMELIGADTQVLLLGDPLQRIYGFIGAVPDIMSVARERISADKIELDKNYRFRDNPEMLKLDKNIRANAFYCFKPDNIDPAGLKAFWANDQKDEANKVIRKIKELHEKNRNEKIAILFRKRGDDSAIFEQQLKEAQLTFFYGMFTDEDLEYLSFNSFCQEEFIKRFGKINSIGKKALEVFSKNIQAKYKGNDTKMSESLFILLDAFVKKVSIDYADISAEDKYSLIIDTFENHQLKQAMEYVDSNIIMSTIHGAKGLEWPYVFVADFERYGLPSGFICCNCENKFLNPVKCACSITNNETFIKDNMLDELSVFYVAVTRARKQIYVSASAKRGNGKQGCFSCFTNIPGISLCNAEKD